LPTDLSGAHACAYRLVLWIKATIPVVILGLVPLLSG
jgi:hypothetical protein